MRLRINENGIFYGSRKKDLKMTPIHIAYLSLFSFGFVDNVRGPLFPEILKTFQVGYSQGSLFFAVSSFFGFLNGLMSSTYLRKFSYLQLLNMATIGLAVSFLGMSYSFNFGVLLLFAGLFGSCLGILGVCQNALVVIGSSPGRRQQLLSGLHSMYGLSSFFSPLAVGMVFQAGEDWRMALKYFCILPLAVVLFTLLTPLPKMKDLPSENHKRNQKSFFGASPLAFVMASCASLYVVAEILLATRLALYFQEVMMLNAADASFKVSVFFLGLLMGRFLFFIIPLKLNLYIALRASLILSFLSIVMGLIYNPLFLVATGLFMAPFYGWSMAYLSELFHDSKLNKALGINVAFQSGFVVAMHLSYGKLSEVLSVKQALWLGPLVLVGSFLCLILTKRLPHENEV